MQGNKVKTNQVKALIKKYPKLKELCTIRKSNSHCYVLGCITNTVDTNGTVNSRVLKVVKNPNSWEMMASHDGPAFNCHIVAILHLPKGGEEVEEIEVEEVEEVTPPTTEEEK